MELVNTHCHSHFCGHGEGEAAQYAAEARKAGLTTLAFTEHYPLSSAFDPDGYLSVPASRMEAYHRDVAQAAQDCPSMDMLLGVELDYLGALEDRRLDQVDFGRYAIVLGSVHFVDGWAFDDPAQKGRWLEPGAPDAIWRRYVELWCDAASDARQPFTAMSHPDLAKKFGYYPSFGLAPLYEQMAEAVASSGRMIEVNTSGSYYACAEMFPSPGLLRAFCRAGVPATVGTDAHVPANVARDIRKGYRALYEAGYRAVTVPTPTGDRRSITIE
ncbi:histidinol-phosphatase HisJ family protein [Parvibacter caecicola]|uniref:Histidinol-phosphatase n=1 Tax=Parvibacter caecicola TaxID=747645 RepID=A0A4T9T9U1_9ACTN|nr:histidinol-phosphatase HisJ family protein [Parvibacter caecicola]TJW12359.1 histidinol-phosphatase HisJ family protein [Parvibacter caecicola]